MRTLLAATLVLRAESASHDETSLMQGLARRVEGKLGAENSRYGQDTSKLMETATKLLKSGASATPDVIRFIDAQIAEIESNVEDAIQDEHSRDQQTLRDRVADLEAIAARVEAEKSALEPRVAAYEEAVSDHKECRQQESQTCSESRACEVELEIRWQHVKTQESLMREIHSEIHNDICVEPACYEESCLPCMSGQCFNWPNVLAMEGPETSQTHNDHVRGPDLYQGAYPIVDYTQDLTDWRSENERQFRRYIAQKPIVEEAWNSYNVQLRECARLEGELEEKVARCDAKQDELDGEICPLVRDQRDAAGTYGRAWHEATEEYQLAAGTCTNAHGDECDIFDQAYLNNGESCSCTGIRAKEWDRKREFETLHIVKCLLSTVYDHVRHSIDTGEPCPTMESHPEETEEAINHCHVINRPCPDSEEDVNDCHLTNHLIIDYCHDFPWNAAIKSLPLECPVPPPPPDRHDPKCSAEYIFQTTGHFGEFRDAHMNPALETVNAHLSDAGWGGCAAPKACVPCLGEDLVFPAVHYTEPSTPCHEHGLDLALGESDGEIFRCRGSWCVPQAARCNGVENCGDGSDEWGCGMDWGNSNLEYSIPDDTDRIPTFCREGANVIPGTADDVQFFCGDGSCIPVEGRCNGNNNCADGSDEEGCPASVTGVTLEPTTGHPASIQTVQLEGRVFTDREYTFKSLGDFTGMKFIEMSNEDKSTPHTHVQMKLRLSQPMTVYVMTQFDPVTGTSQTLPWLAADGWTATTLSGVEYSGLRMTPAKYWSGHLDAVDQEVSHYGTATVWEKTFPAGVVSMKGNGGGEGYIWTSGVEGGHGSYLTFLAHPSHRPTAPVPPTGLPGAEEYIGCFVDDSDRDLGAMVGSTNNAATNTFELCRQACAGHQFMSLQYGGECFCANEYATAPKYELVADSFCDRVVEPCSSNSHNCGGTWYQAIYRIAPAPSPARYTHALADTKCPHRHEDRLFRNPTGGSSGITLEECYAQCLATEGCNHFSHGAHNGGNVCMGCTTLANAQTHAGFTAYDMA